MAEQAKITTLTDHAGNLVAPRTTAGAVSYGDKTVEGAITEVHTILATKGDMPKSVYDADGDGVVDKAITATKLQTARTINGVAFDGTSNISITAPANGGNSATASGLSFEVAASAPATVTDNKVTFVYG